MIITSPINHQPSRIYAVGGHAAQLDGRQLTVERLSPKHRAGSIALFSILLHCSCISSLKTFLYQTTDSRRGSRLEAQHYGNTRKPHNSNCDNEAWMGTWPRRTRNAQHILELYYHHVPRELVSTFFESSRRKVWSSGFLQEQRSLDDRRAPLPRNDHRSCSRAMAICLPIC